jgi:hypothetical protein
MTSGVMAKSSAMYVGLLGQTAGGSHLTRNLAGQLNVGEPVQGCDDDLDVQGLCN